MAHGCQVADNDAATVGTPLNSNDLPGGGVRGPRGSLSKSIFTITPRAIAIR
jgi:hypothetical protein